MQSQGKDIAFTQKTVCYTWTSVAKEQWCHAKDPIQSAQAYLEKDGTNENIKVLEMPEIEGARTIAFYVNDFVQEWAQHTNTFLVDLMCEYEF